uniref:C2H2-type domain-containing protein n=1 Tax=Latimeria chalumnae TaxID=7897 RepID=H3AGM1_LATCH
DEEDVHKCGRCCSEFTSLEAFLQHKLQKRCQRVADSCVHVSSSPMDQELQKTEVLKHAVPTIEESITVAQVVFETSSMAGEINYSINSGENMHTKESVASEQQLFQSPSSQMASEVRMDHASPNSLEEGSSTEMIKVQLALNEEGRYLCQMCDKTFKTANILKVHMVTHSDKKDFVCTLCGNAFRTKGSLIRHNRRHTDERPYKCRKCGMSFRESGALTRHLKSLTPCTERIKFNTSKEIIVNKDGIPKGTALGNSSSWYWVHIRTGRSHVVHGMEHSAPLFIHLIFVNQSALEEIGAFRVPLCAPVPALLEVPCKQWVSKKKKKRGGLTNRGLLCLRHSAKKGNLLASTFGLWALSSVPKFKQTNKQTKIDTKTISGQKNYKCPYCSQIFSTASHRRLHIKTHLGYKPFKCQVCGKEFVTGYLLKKHTETHIGDRRFKCGECGKLYRTIAHVRDHMRAHTDERPYPCPECGKHYKTKKNYENVNLKKKKKNSRQGRSGQLSLSASLNRITNSNGDINFKCDYKRKLLQIAQHATKIILLHYYTGGCHPLLKESEQIEVSDESQLSTEGVAATIISEDPHTVLVEFSSVVADTQEYIIEVLEFGKQSVIAKEGFILGRIVKMDSHIMKVVQQIVNQANSGHQIIVQNVTVDENAVTADGTDTITIATPESLTEQVAMTLASAIQEGAVLTTEGAIEMSEGAVAMVASEDVEMMQHAEEFVIASQDGDVEVQTVVV